MCKNESGLLRIICCILTAIFIVPATFAGTGEEETVRILRDPWGVPHVLGESDYGALYGFGWALAEGSAGKRSERILDCAGAQE